MGFEPIHTGMAVVWGIPATGIAIGAGIGAAIQAWKSDEMDMELTSQKELHHDPVTGAVIGTTIFQGMRTVRLRYYPYGSTQSVANIYAIIPPVGAEITISDAIHTDIAGVYSVEQVSKPLRKDSKLFVDMTLVRYGDNSNNTTIRISEAVASF